MMAIMGWGTTEEIGTARTLVTAVTMAFEVNTWTMVSAFRGPLRTAGGTDLRRLQ